MALNIKQKEDVRKIRYGWNYAINEKGEPLYKNHKDEKPDLEVGQIRKMMVETLQKKGYKVYFVKPPAANCIIRVYKDEQVYEDGMTYRILGANCYTKSSDGRWHTVDARGEEYGIDFAKSIFRIWFYQDEYWDVSVDFFDTYIKLVKDV